MSKEDKFWRLASRARAEQPPRVNVAEGVMAAIQSLGGAGAERVEPLIWVAAPAAAAAIAVVLLALSGHATWSDVVLARLSELPWWLL